jgi:hypothetical protein
MTTKIDIANLYCNIFKELLDDLEKLYPNDSKLSMLKISCNGMILYDPMYIAKTVNNYLFPYYTQILKKDEDFFVNQIEDDFDNDSFISNEIKRIKNIWVQPEIKDTTKETIWRYFKNLVKAGKIFNNFD